MKGQIAIPKLSFVFVIPILGGHSCRKVCLEGSKKIGPGNITTLTKQQQPPNTIADFTAQAASLNASQVAGQEGVATSLTEEEDQDNSYDNNTNNNDGKGIAATHTRPVGWTPEQTKRKVGYKGPTEDQPNISTESSSKSETKQRESNTNGKRSQKADNEEARSSTNGTVRSLDQLSQSSNRVGSNLVQDPNAQVPKDKRQGATSETDLTTCASSDTQKTKKNYDRSRANFLGSIKHKVPKLWKKWKGCFQQPPDGSVKSLKEGGGK